MIYLFDLGINGAVAQAHVSDYLRQEHEILKKNKAPTQMMTVRWLENLADIFESDVRLFADYRKFDLLDISSLHHK